MVVTGFQDLSWSLAQVKSFAYEQADITIKTMLLTTWPFLAYHSQGNLKIRPYTCKEYSGVK